nr:spore germination protein GerW family protein [uncultured Actinotalea sp.]
METFDAGRALADLLTVRRVFGEPVVRDDVTVIPVARVVGGGGGGSGTGTVPPYAADDRAAADGPGASGSGGGLGVRVTPLGVYVVRGADVTWRPALDLQRVIAGGQTVGALAVLTVLVAVLRRRR